MSNLDKLQQLRQRAKKQSSLKPPEPVKAKDPEPKPEPVTKKPLPKAPKVKALKKTPSAEQGELERTSITWKADDRRAMAQIQAFFLERGQRVPTGSSIVRLSLLHTAESLKDQGSVITRIHEEIMRGDGRRASKS